MLIIALVLAVIGLAALVTAVVTSNELIAWVCIGASVIGVVLLIVDALRERSRGAKTGDTAPADAGGADVAQVVDTADEPVDYPDEPVAEPQIDGNDVSDEVYPADADADADAAPVESSEEHKN
ncbi:hypothetical protein M2272_001711 [Mycobacterium frederiksbergense]|uniref:Transmembrane protein n=1 Tax=Mycolicibacterium frederiksbergense TaxID=117567 RepID=A0ABT6KWJ9_9MYCO|nr:hypothetical protein [Mycolicibacterium frederiksbergense]MDH6195082.1 hypothetical protein [Mycolicibacterium frederiksbergense]